MGPQQGEHGLGDAFQSLPGRGLVRVFLVEDRQVADEGRLAGEHEPEGHPQAVDVRAGVEFLLVELLRAGKGRGAAEPTAVAEAGPAVTV